MIENMTKFMSCREAAKIIGCCERTVRAMVYDGRLPAGKLGKLVRIKPDDVYALIDKCPVVQ